MKLRWEHMLLALSIGVLIGIAVGVNTVEAGERTPLSCDGKPADFHAERAKALIDKAYDNDRFLDATPAKKAERRKWQAHKLCLHDLDRRDRIGRYVDLAKVTFAAHFESLLSPPGRATLEAIAACESGGDPTAVSDNGTYRGKYQFDYGTWASVGGSGDPAAAPEREQDYRAARLHRARGAQPWPICGR